MNRFRDQVGERSEDGIVSTVNADEQSLVIKNKSERGGLWAKFHHPILFRKKTLIWQATWSDNSAALSSVFIEV
jgi:hypothetical protein